MFVVLVVVSYLRFLCWNGSVQTRTDVSDHDLLGVLSPAVIEKIPSQVFAPAPAREQAVRRTASVVANHTKVVAAVD